MDSCANGNADDHVRPYFADDLAHRAPAACDALLPRHLGRIILCGSELNLPDEIFDPALQSQATNDDTRDNRDRQAGHDVERGNLPAEHAEQQHDRDFVDNWRGDEKRKCHAKRNARFNKANEERDGTARTEWGDNAKQCREYVADANTFAAEHPEETADEADSDDHTFIDLYLALASVPSIGRSLLGATGYGQLKESLKPGQQAIIVAGNGRYSFKGSGYVRGGIFDRIEVVQGDDIFRFRDRDHHRLGDLDAGAPYFKEIALFTVPSGQSLDPTQPFTLKLLAQRAVAAREKAFLTFELNYALPDKYMTAEKPAPAARTMPSGDSIGPSPLSAQLRSATTVRPSWRAWPISDSVPHSPPTAIAFLTGMRSMNRSSLRASSSRSP